MIDPKIVERIKKLLELSTSPNAHEAQLAMEQAQKLMAKHSIDQSDIDGIENTILESEYWNSAFARQGVIEFTPSIAGTICPIFGVYVLIRTKRKMVTRIDMFGFQTNIDIARFALDSILAQGSIEAREAYKKYRTITFGDSFWEGFALGIKEKFGQYKEASNGIVLYDKVKMHVRELGNGTFRPQSGNDLAQSAGIDAGKRAEIRRGITTQNEGKLLK